MLNRCIYSLNYLRAKDYCNCQPA